MKEIKIQEMHTINLIALAGALCIGDPVLRIISLDKVLYNVCWFRKTYLLAVSEGVSQSWDPAARVDGKEPGFSMNAL